MPAINQVLVSFYESTQAAEDALACVGKMGAPVGAVLLTRDSGRFRSSHDTPAPLPFGSLAGLCLGLLLGSAGGQAGLVTGFFFGLYAGAFFDLWRFLGRVDLLDEIQRGMRPDDAAVVVFAPEWHARRIDACLASVGGITVHRFQGTSIEDDVAREVAETIREADLTRGGRAGDLADLRRLRTIDAIVDLLLAEAGTEFEFEMDLLRLDQKARWGWRRAWIGRRVSRTRASYQRTRHSLEASRSRLRVAGALSGRVEEVAA